MFNSGVMLINVDSMYETYENFLDLTVKINHKSIHTAFDQGALNHYYVNRWDRLPIEYNWKPYWGFDENIQILHFHGPKPHHINLLLQHKTIHNDILDGLYNMNSGAYEYYLQVYQMYKDSFNWKAYVRRYKDLQKAKINTMQKAIEHYLMLGKDEGRIIEFGYDFTKQSKIILFLRSIFMRLKWVKFH